MSYLGLGTWDPMVGGKSQLSCSHAPITPNFPSGFNCEIFGDYVQI